MIDKSLLIRLFSCFVLLSFITVIIVKNKEEESLNTALLKEKQNLKKSYSHSFKRLKNKVDLIFFNNLHDENIYTAFINKDKKKLFSYLKNDFFYLKSHGLKQLSFYTKENKLFFKMNKNIDSNSLDLIPFSLRKKELDFYELLKQNNVISFTKPIFNKELDFIGSLKLEFSLNSLIKDISEHSDFNTFFLLSKKSFNSEHFNKFLLNKNYFISSDNFTLKRYSLKNLKDIKKSYKHNIELDMKNKEEFSFIYSSLKVLNAAFFIPIKNINSYTDVYLFAFINKEKTIYNQISNNYFWILILVHFIYLFILFLIYKYFRMKKLKNSVSKKYEDLLLSIDKYVVMVHTDTKGIITYVSQAFCNICGYSKEELINRNINILRHPDVSPKFYEALWKQLHEKGYWEGEIKNLDKFANSYWVKGSIVSKYDSNNRLIGYISIRVSTTNSKQLKKINNLLKEDLSNKLNEIKMKDKDLLDNTKVALMSKVLDAVAHQWKTPISNISINLANLKGKIRTKEINKKDIYILSENIEKELKTLSISLNEFKSFFPKNSYGDKYDINNVIEEAVSSLKEDISRLNTTVSLSSKENLLCYGIHNEFKHIFINLLKYSLNKVEVHKIKNPTIDISVIEDNNEIIIKYCDNISIENRVIKKIFNEEYIKNFSQEDINIYITKLLIEKSGASVWFEKNNNSLVFYIKLVSEDRRKKER